MRRYRTPTSHHQTHSNRADEQVFESPSRSEPLFDQECGLDPCLPLSNPAAAVPRHPPNAPSSPN
jgi:hypothetical protein